VGAILLGGRHYLRSDEFLIEDRKYSEFLEINFAAGWLTPFDPRTELRKGNVYHYWTEVRRLLETEGEEAASRYIRANKSLYTIPRTPAYESIQGLIGNKPAGTS
jgi:hypothetical protein